MSAEAPQKSTWRRNDYTDAAQRTTNTLTAMGLDICTTIDTNGGGPAALEARHGRGRRWRTSAEAPRKSTWRQNNDTDAARRTTNALTTMGLNICPTIDTHGGGPAALEDRHGEDSAGGRSTEAPQKWTWRQNDDTDAARRTTNTLTTMGLNICTTIDTHGGGPAALEAGHG